MRWQILGTCLLGVWLQACLATVFLLRLLAMDWEEELIKSWWDLKPSMFSKVLKNQKMLRPLDPIDVTGSRALDMATDQPGGACVCSGSQKCQWEVCLHEIFLVLKSLQMRKPSPLRSPKVCRNQLNQPTSHPDFEGHLLSIMHLCPGFLRTMNRRNTQTEWRQCQQTLGLVPGNACMRKSDPKVFPHPQKNQNWKKRKSSPRDNGSKWKRPENISYDNDQPQTC